MNRIREAADGHNGAATAEPLDRGTLVPELRPTPSMARLESHSWRASLAALDAFRTLALTIDRFAEERPIRTITVLSAAPSEGRSLSAELLALALSELRPPVRLLDADPFQRASETRRRRHRAAGGKKRTDISSTSSDGRLVSLGERSANDVTLPFARIPLALEAFPSHSAFLHDVRTALATESAMGARVLVDVPACSVSSIGFAVARMADAAIYVVRPGRATVETHRDILAQAALLGVDILGILLNEG